MANETLVEFLASNLNLNAGVTWGVDGEGDGEGEGGTDGGKEMEDPIYRHSPTVTVILIFAYIVILVIGVVGNSLVVVVVLRSPRMRTVTNLFILNLAVADLLVILFCLPPTLLSNILVPWVLGHFMCKTVPYVQGVSVCASVYSLVAVSMDRFIAIWFPLGGGLTKGKARIIILVIWMASCTLALPWALYFDLVSPDAASPTVEFCVEVWPEGVNGDIYYLIGNLFLCYLFPLSGISLCYLLIWVRVLRRHVPTDSTADTLQKIHHKAKIGVLKMLIVVVLAFLLSWLPLYILFTRMKFGETLSPVEENMMAIATPIAQWLGSSNSCINPVLYAYLNVKFRRAFISLQPQCCQPQQSFSHTSTKSSLLIPRPQTSLYNVTTGV